MKKQIPTLKRHPVGTWLSLMFGLLFTITASAQEVKVSIDVDRQPLERVLSLLEQQSGYRFFYSNDHVSGKAPVTIKVSEEALSVVLKQILPERNLTYKVVKQQIILSSVKPAASAAKITVRGRVTDSTGEPLIGVSVTSGTTGVTTDINGNYSIQVPAGVTLLYSYVGCAPVQKKASDNNPLDIVMVENAELLDDIVVIGYGTMDKKELTSAISHVSEKDFLSISSSDPASLIKG